MPALEKFRPRIFDNVRAICAALSSQVQWRAHPPIHSLTHSSVVQALPMLKKKFANPRGGLLIHEFVETLFQQLHEVQPQPSP